MSGAWNSPNAGLRVNVVLPPVIDLLVNKGTAPTGVAGQLKVTTKKKSAV